MDSKRLGLVMGATACAVIAYGVVNLTMDYLARRVEVEQQAYLWWSEEWMQLFNAHNFVDRGKGRILLSGSSEAREDFLFEEFEADLPGFEVYNNAYSRHNVATFLLVLQYIESVYGPSAMPEKIVLGVTPGFALDEWPIESSYLPRVIDRYSPSVSVDLDSRPPRLVPKSWIDSIVARYQFLTHQSRRYKGALRGVVRAIVGRLVPRLADRYSLRSKLVPSKYHDRPSIDQKQQLEALRRLGLTVPNPADRAETLRMEWAALSALAAKHNIALYVVSLPQSTWVVDGQYKGTYDEYERILRDVVGDTPFLDLSGFLGDDQFYDIAHANLAASRRISERVARFVRESDEMKRRGGPALN